MFNIIDQKDLCPYCSADLSDRIWQSHFESTKLYKSLKCSCGKLISICVDFLGSGHDNWDNKESWKDCSDILFEEHNHKLRNLETKVIILKEHPYGGHR